MASPMDIVAGNAFYYMPTKDAALGDPYWRINPLASAPNCETYKLYD